MRHFFLLIFLCSLSCKSDKKYHYTGAKEGTVVQINAIADIAAFQKKLNTEFKNPETSPLPDRYRKDFDGLEFFAPDTTLIVLARLELTPNALPFDMPTTTERLSREVVYGIAYFTLNGSPQQLEIYQNKELNLQEGYEDYLFLPFTDETNGETSYMGGRYLDLRIPSGTYIEINFNKAYNPSCVYNKKYSCPIVPSVNALDFKIEAGVKDFKLSLK